MFSDPHVGWVHVNFLQAVTLSYQENSSCFNQSMFQMWAATKYSTDINRGFESHIRQVRDTSESQTESFIVKTHTHTHTHTFVSPNQRKKNSDIRNDLVFCDISCSRTLTLG